MDVNQIVPSENHSKPFIPGICRTFFKTNPIDPPTKPMLRIIKIPRQPKLIHLDNVPSQAKRNESAM
jgi:hypothetical protein